MGYQALLFCSDEKLSRVVSQVFGELEFAVDPVTEPFAAVKKLMAQHFDAIVVDCENEQNSALLFKSARNSTFNQGSLAIALVEGQAGVAKAYRIGANLVLTKPINVEQAKGTLRVARGLLRKTSDAASEAGHASAAAAASSAASSAASTTATAPSGNRNLETVAGPPTHGPSPEFRDQAPAMTSLAKVEEEPVPAPAQAKEWPSLVPAPAASAAVVSAKRETEETTKTERITERITKTDPPKAAAASALSTGSKSKGAASAPAPAKEIPATANNQPEREAHEKPLRSAAGTTQEVTSSRAADNIAFSSYPNDVGRSGGSNKILIVAAALLLLAVAGYVGWTKFGPIHQTTTSQSVTKTPERPSESPSASNPVPTSASVPPASPAAPENALTTAPVPRTSAAHLTQPLTDSSSTTRITIRPETDGKESSTNPIVVKSSAKGGRAQIEEAPAPLPSPLAIESSDASALNGVLSSASSDVARPTLAQTKISQGVSQGLVIKRVQPKYPAAALATHLEGAVLMEVTVNKEGNVVSPKILSGDRTLAAAALEAVRQWRYKPYYLNGEPIEIQTQITINFKAR